ncbi:hypothetical protein O6H91_16G094800 [Diphasiastrum complanatum]|uniref:Uncharacterized protein n=1 Tax=Diphasiastrum complanatum TaxID=34168 RepID=A0ACC2BF46_DIPCM|nr:hypothetical protein O6H91_16G094800 [Diphasiastrum complanatum]
MAKADMELSWKLWPPSNETRALVAERIASNLLCFPWSQQKHELLSEADAAEKAKSIEEQAFQAAQRQAEAADNNAGGGQALKGSTLVGLYAKEASKAALWFLKPGSKGLATSEEHSTIDQTSDENSVAAVESVRESVSDKKERAASDFAELDQKEIPVSVVSGADQTEICDGKGVDGDRKEDVLFDISTGERRMLDKAAAEKLFQPVQSQIGCISRVCLSNQSFGIDAAEVAAEFLSEIKETLIEADLSDIVAGRHEDEALKVMRILSAALEGSNLRVLNLSDNALGEKGVRAFSTLLQSQQALQQLYFKNNGISVEAATAVCELLPSGKDLVTLHFHNNMSGDEGAKALSVLIKTATFLEDFQFSSSRVAEEGAIALTEALRSGTSLKKIDLRDNMFGPKGGFELGLTLRQHQGLTEVYLSDLGLEDQGAKSILEALKDNVPCLKILDLGGNEITAAAASHIATCIKEKHQLMKLGLAENELRDRGCKIVSQALIEGHNCLRELDLSVNYLSNLGAIAAGEAITNKKEFKLLNLNGNHISMAGLDALRELLAKCCSGEAVLGPLDDNEEDDFEDGEEDEQSSIDYEDNDPNEDTEKGEEKLDDEEGLDLSLGNLAVVD